MNVHLDLIILLNKIKLEHTTEDLGMRLFVHCHKKCFKGKLMDINIYTNTFGPA